MGTSLARYIYGLQHLYTIHILNSKYNAYKTQFLVENICVCFLRSKKMFPSFRNTFCHPGLPLFFWDFTVKMQLGRKTRDKLAIFSWSRYDCVILDAERLFSIENLKIKSVKSILFWGINRCPKSL